MAKIMKKEWDKWRNEMVEREPINSDVHIFFIYRMIKYESVWRRKDTRQFYGFESDFQESIDLATSSDTTWSKAWEATLNEKPDDG